MTDQYPESVPTAKIGREAKGANLPQGFMPDGKRRMSYVTFPDAPKDQPAVCGILITKNEDTNEYTAYVREYDGFVGPDADVVAMVATHVDMRNLNHSEQDNG